MTPERHRQIVEDEAKGRLLIGVDTIAARRFFTEVSHESIKAQIGEAAYLERLVVRGSMVLSFALLISALGLSVWALGWWSLIGFPATAIVCLVHYANSARGDAGLGFAVLAVAGAIGSYFFTAIPEVAKYWLFAFAGSLFFARFTYTIATALLRALVIRNWRAFEALEGNGVIIREM